MKLELPVSSGLKIKAGMEDDFNLFSFITFSSKHEGKEK